MPQSRSLHVTAYLMQICAVPTGQRTASGWGRDPCAARFWTKCLHLKGTFSPLWSSVTVLRRWLPKCRWICKQVQPREPPSQPCIYPCDWPGTHWRLLAGRRRPAVSTGLQTQASCQHGPASVSTGAIQPCPACLLPALICSTGPAGRDTIQRNLDSVRDERYGTREAVDLLAVCLILNL